MVLRMVEPNKWYFAVDRSKCGDPIPFLEAPSPEEKSEVKTTDDSGPQVPALRHTDTYAPALMSRRQLRQERPSYGYLRSRPKSQSLAQWGVLKVPLLPRGFFTGYGPS
jgi:hypothetical protein